MNEKNKYRAGLAAWVASMLAPAIRPKFGPIDNGSEAELQLSARMAVFLVDEIIAEVNRADSKIKKEDRNGR